FLALASPSPKLLTTETRSGSSTRSRRRRLSFPASEILILQLVEVLLPLKCATPWEANGVTSLLTMSAPAQSHNLPMTLWQTSTLMSVQTAMSLHGRSARRAWSFVASMSPTRSHPVCSLPESLLVGLTTRTWCPLTVRWWFMLQPEPAKEIF